MSGSRWVITPLQLSGLWTFLYSSSVYSCYLLISSASVRSIPFLSFIVPIFAWNIPLVSLIFLKRSLVFHSLLFSSISLHLPPTLQQPMLTHASARDSWTLPGLLHPEPLPLGHSTADPFLHRRHLYSSVSVSVGSLGPGVHKVFLSPLIISLRVWDLILNSILPLLPSCWGFSFALGHGVSPQSHSSTAQRLLQKGLQLWLNKDLEIRDYPELPKRVLYAVGMVPYEKGGGGQFDADIQTEEKATWPQRQKG